MYTIKQAASRAGVSVPLLRAWERRYGIVAPERTPAGYRLYDEDAIAVIRAMRHLVDEGWSPSTAAASLRTADAETIGSLAGDSPAARPESGSGTTQVADRFVAAASALDNVEVEAVLDDVFSRGSFEPVAERYLLPALAALGEAWAAGRIDVAAEHAASHAVLRRLAAAYDAASRAQPSRGAVLVGLPPGSRHELGALAFAVAARRAGLPIIYLGPDLPVEDWVDAAREAAARAAVIGAVTPSDVEAAVEVIIDLRAAHPALVVAIGGGESSAVLAALPEDARAASVQLPAGVRDAVDALRLALRDGTR
jgi:MerR family transcriptional regulator, light-induced transcriptional regulator